jgi:hypothetical protein
MISLLELIIDFEGPPWTLTLDKIYITCKAGQPFKPFINDLLGGFVHMAVSLFQKNITFSYDEAVGIQTLGVFSSRNFLALTTVALSFVFVN